MLKKLKIIDGIRNHLAIKYLYTDTNIWRGNTYTRNSVLTNRYVRTECTHAHTHTRTHACMHVYTHTHAHGAFSSNYCPSKVCFKAPASCTVLQYTTWILTSFLAPSKGYERTLKKYMLQLYIIFAADKNDDTKWKMKNE